MMDRLRHPDGNSVASINMDSVENGRCGARLSDVQAVIRTGITELAKSNQVTDRAFAVFMVLTRLIEQTPSLVSVPKVAPSRVRTPQGLARQRVQAPSCYLSVPLLGYLD